MQTASCRMPPSPDLAAERGRASFPPAELTRLMRGGAAGVASREGVLARLKADPLLGRGRLEDHFLSREEAFKLGLERYARVYELGLPSDEAFAGMGLGREGGLLEKSGSWGLHTGMFMPTIQLLGTDAQREKWLALARTAAIVGTYAQTELGHGTNLTKLETTAHYDAVTQEFVLHSPTVTATKWWPGGLGKCATHAVVMARLLLGGQDRGQHSFIVQLRDLRSHQPLPGIELGDIGPKMGYSRVDNGFLILNQVRVPREQHLARHGSVEPDGTYVPSGDNPKAVYGTMLIVRVYLVEESSVALQHATTVATRYSAVRRQGGGGGGGGPERQVLEYQTQQARLFPLIAAALGCHFAARALREDYRGFRATADVRVLPELHARSAGLKAYCTSLAVAGVETCRLLCGGHGYSMASGLPDLFREFAPSQTYEGDNVVMLLQCARWLVKQVAASEAAAGAWAAGAALPPTTDPGDYLRRAAAPPPPPPPAAFAASSAAVLAGLAEASRLLTRRAAATLASQIAAGVPQELAWSEHASVDLAAAAAAHSRLLCCAYFADAVARLERGDTRLVADRAAATDLPSARTLAVLRTARDLFLLSCLEQHAAMPLLESGWLSAAHLAELRERSRALLGTLRPEAVGLTDGFGLSDLELNSVLGREDGDVYPALLDWARRSPLNRSEVAPGIVEHMKPIMGRSLVPGAAMEGPPKAKL